MKRFKRILVVMLLAAVAFIISYRIYTGGQTGA